MGFFETSAKVGLACRPYTVDAASKMRAIGLTVLMSRARPACGCVAFDSCCPYADVDWIVFVVL